MARFEDDDLANYDWSLTYFEFLFDQNKNDSDDDVAGLPAICIVRRISESRCLQCTWQILAPKKRWHQRITDSSNRDPKHQTHWLLIPCVLQTRYGSVPFVVVDLCADLLWSGVLISKNVLSTKFLHFFWTEEFKREAKIVLISFRCRLFSLFKGANIRWWVALSFVSITATKRYYCTEGQLQTFVVQCR